MCLEFLKDRGFGIKEGEWRIVNVALDGHKVEFSIHESDWRRFEGTDRFVPFLTNQAASILEQEAYSSRA
jgi:hypothetical protein